MLPKLLSANALYQRIQRPGDLLLLDVRTAEEFQRARIETRHTPQTLHIPYMAFIEDDTLDAALGRIPIERPVVVVCAHGGSSEYVAGILRRHGYNVANLAGGMETWARLQVVRPVVESESVEIYQIDRVARGCLSYVIISNGWAAVIDPSHEITEYRRLLGVSGALPRLIIDTHAHADHISGGRALAEATGAPYYLHPDDAVDPFDFSAATVPFEALRDNHRFRLGDVTLRAVHVPGHTLGQVALLAATGRGDTYLFSGDALFLRDIGRSDLGGQAESWARLAYHSLFGTLRRAVMPDALVLPGHYATTDEADARGLYALTAGELWQTNRELLFDDQESFVRRMVAHLPETPPEYRTIKRVNLGLEQLDPQQMSAMETGRNICALAMPRPEPAERVPA